MSQYTFSFVRSEYDRIPIQLKRQLDEALEKSNADPSAKELVAEVCDAVSRAVADICKYSQDQLKVW
jgi:hypothetical protein